MIGMLLASIAAAAQDIATFTVRTLPSFAGASEVTIRHQPSGPARVSICRTGEQLGAPKCSTLTIAAERALAWQSEFLSALAEFVQLTHEETARQQRTGEEWVTLDGISCEIRLANSSGKFSWNIHPSDSEPSPARLRLPRLFRMVERLESDLREMSR